MTVISKLLILLGSIGTSGVGCYATYNSLFSSSLQVTDQSLNDRFDLKNVNEDQSLQINSKLPIIDQFLNDKTLIVKNDGFDLSNVYKNKYLQIDSKLSAEDQKKVFQKNYTSLYSEINSLQNKINQQTSFINSKIYNLEEEKKKEIDDLEKLEKEFNYKLAIYIELQSKIKEFKKTTTK